MICTVTHIKLNVKLILEEVVYIPTLSKPPGPIFSGLQMKPVIIGFFVLTYILQEGKKETEGREGEEGGKKQRDQDTTLLRGPSGRHLYETDIFLFESGSPKIPISRASLCTEQGDRC